MTREERYKTIAKEIHFADWLLYYHYGFGEKTHEALKEAVEVINSLSAVPEREKGEWVFDGFCGCFGYDNNCKCHCSKCNKKIIVDGVYVVGEGYRMNPEGHTPNFCSNCGSDMRKGN